jgi:dienelactone hydrolase
MAKTHVEYRDDHANLKDILVSDPFAGVRPGVVLFPDARGIGDHAIECAERLAPTGIAVLVADLYGEGLTAHSMEQAGRLMGDLRADVARWRGRAEAARQALSQQTSVDPEQIAAIGYCFGGSTALELARSGAPLAAVVSFHGGLASPRPQDAARIKAKVLVCHGAADPLVPPAQVAAFESEMMKTSVDWQLHVYGGAVHAFTNPAADTAGTPALAYNAAADRRSWAAMLDLFREVFGPRTN